MTSPRILPALILAPLAAATAADRPNIVYLLSDDVGWSDVSIHPGGSIPTPHIDHLFKEGVELRQFMGWAVCSPTRAMLMTARHPFRVGTGPETGGELAKEEATIAEGFKANGYRTGVFGKWHNGEDPDTPEYRKAFAEAWKSSPNKKLVGGLGVNAHGFDEAWVYYGGGADYFTRRTVQGRGPVSWWHNLTYMPDEAGYTDDLVTQRALEFIRANKDVPFFCYVPFHIVHGPLQAKDTDLQEVDAKVTDQTKRTYEAMIRSMDKNVAAILTELEQLRLRDNTIVVFSSDNGATKDGCNLPFRGGKHTLYEGGTHLPTVIHWPKAGLAHRTWNGLCGNQDMFPTLMAMADCAMPPTRPLDGKNIWPALRDGTASPVESYYWAWHERDAIRTDRWRMHRLSDRCELYDIQTDIGETTDVAAAHPDVVQELTGKMDAWVASMGAALSHRPPPASLDAKPAPEGEVLEVTITVDHQVKAREHQVVPFAVGAERADARDYVEFDIAYATDSLPSGCFYTPFRGNTGDKKEIGFRAGVGIDQFGREQAAGPAPKGGAGVWEHRVVGLCSFAPGPLGHHGLAFAGGKAGTYKVYLDNLRVRHVDGQTTVLWSEGKDTWALKKPELLPGFTDLKIRTVPAASLQFK